MQVDKSAAKQRGQRGDGRRDRLDPPLVPALAFAVLAGGVGYPARQGAGCAFT